MSTKKRRYQELTLTNVINKEHVKECDRLKEKQDEINQVRRELTLIQKKCDDEIYHTLSGYFTKSSTAMDVLLVLRRWMKKNKAEIGFKGFLNLFPRDSSLKGTNFRRQHVYECICRLLLMLGYVFCDLGY